MPIGRAPSSASKPINSASSGAEIPLPFVLSAILNMRSASRKSYSVAWYSVLGAGRAIYLLLSVAVATGENERLPAALRDLVESKHALRVQLLNDLCRGLTRESRSDAVRLHALG